MNRINLCVNEKVCFNLIMSSELKKHENSSFYSEEILSKKVNVIDLMNKMNAQKKKDQQTSFLYSLAGLSFVIILGVVLTI